MKNIFKTNQTNTKTSVEILKITSVEKKRHSNSIDKGNIRLVKNQTPKSDATKSIKNLITQLDKPLTAVPKIPKTALTHTLSANPNTVITSKSLSPQKQKINTYQKIKILPDQTELKKGKKTLLIDLDETLVHSGFKPFDKCSSDIILNIELEKKIHEIYVLKRPGCEEFLENLSQHYELVIFTASLSQYADPLIDKIDPNGYVSFRLFREHCSFVNGVYIKDLSIINRELKDIILIDNNPISYALNVENGLPIKSWYDDKNDMELNNYLPILQFLAYTKDIRKYLRKCIVNNNISYQEAFNIICTQDNIGQGIMNTEKSITQNSNNNQTNNNNNNNINNQTNNNNYTNSNKPVKIERKKTNEVKDRKSVDSKERRTVDSHRSGNSGTSNSESTSKNNHNPFVRAKTMGNEDKKINENKKKDQSININIINNHINNYIINKEDKVIKEKSTKLNVINSFRTNFSEEPQKKTELINPQLELNSNKNIFNHLSPINKSQTGRSSKVSNTNPKYTAFIKIKPEKTTMPISVKNNITSGLTVNTPTLTTLNKVPATNKSKMNIKFNIVTEKFLDRNQSSTSVRKSTKGITSLTRNSSNFTSKGPSHSNLLLDSNNKSRGKVKSVSVSTGLRKQSNTSTSARGTLNTTEVGINSVISLKNSQNTKKQIKLSAKELYNEFSTRNSNNRISTAGERPSNLLLNNKEVEKKIFKEIVKENIEVDKKIVKEVVKENIQQIKKSNHSTPKKCNLDEFHEITSSKIIGEDNIKITSFNSLYTNLKIKKSGL